MFTNDQLCIILHRRILKICEQSSFSSRITHYYEILDEKSTISNMVNALTMCPMNLPLWVKLSKYPIDQNAIQVNKNVTSKRDLLKTFFDELTTNDPRINRHFQLIGQTEGDGRYPLDAISTHLDEKFFSK